MVGFRSWLQRHLIVRQVRHQFERGVAGVGDRGDKSFEHEKTSSKKS
jgi:hypothetical protein